MNPFRRRQSDDWDELESDRARDSDSRYDREDDLLKDDANGNVIRKVVFGLVGVILIGVIGLLAYRYITAFSSPPLPSPSQINVATVASTGTALTSGIESIVLRYDRQGNLVEARNQSGARIANPGSLNVPMALDKIGEGVALAQISQALSKISVLRGAAFDPTRAQLILIGEPGQGTFDADDLRVALRSVLSGNDPGVSIDPGLNANEMIVRYDGPTKDTHFGWVMFEADRRMKTLGLGKDNLTGQPVSASVPGFATHLDLIVRLEPNQSSNREPTWHRFWLTPKRMTIETSADGNSMRFTDASIQVLTECLDKNLKPLSNCQAPAAIAFANHLTENYAGYAAEYPVFRQLEELGKLVALAKWMQSKKLPLDLGWLDVNNVARVNVPMTTPAITVTREASKTETTSTGVFIQTQIFSLHGGVKFQFENIYIAPPSKDPTLGESAIRARPAEKTNVWTVVDSARNLQALAFSTREQDRGGVLPARALTDLEIGKVNQTPIGLTRRVGAGKGEFGAEWMLDLPDITLPGANISARPHQTAPLELVPSQLLWIWRGMGERKLFEFEGWDQNGRRHFTRPGVTPRESIIWTPDKGYVFEIAGGVSQQFDNTGRLMQWSDASGQWARFSYDGHRLARIEHRNGASLTVQYDNARISQVITRDGKRRKFQYDAAGRLVTVTDENNAGTARYEYDAANRIVAEWDGQGALVQRNEYDADGQMSAFTQNGRAYKITTTASGTELAYQMPTIAPQRAPASNVDAILNRLPQAKRNDATFRQQFSAIVDKLDAAARADLEKTLAQPNSELYLDLVQTRDWEFMRDHTPRFVTDADGADLKFFAAEDTGILLLRTNLQAKLGPAAMLEKLVRYRQLQRAAPDQTSVFFSEYATGLRVLVNDTFFEIQPGEVAGMRERLERALDFIPGVNPPQTFKELAARNSKQFGEILAQRGHISANAEIIVLDGDWLDVNLQHALPMRKIFRTYSTNVAQILNRLRYQQTLTIQKNQVVVLNAMPSNAQELKNIDKPNDSPLEWTETKNHWDQMIANAGITTQAADHPAFLKALQENKHVIVLTAHSDGITIYFANGTRFTASSLTDAIKEKIRANQPIVYLLSCNAASIRQPASLAQSLLDAGAQGVIAPAAEVSPKVELDVFKRFLDSIGKDTHFLDALWKAIQGTDMQNWIGRRQIFPRLVPA
ncbi:MAG: hypothetical protein HZC40_04180 [Chloroflexi bacterium]|nr:hypothetical protein [Chloroflexota bacterium]